MSQRLMALLTHGFGAHQQGQLAEAEHCYQQVLSIQPQQIDALYLLGLLKLQLGDLPNAATSLNNVVTLAPDHVDAHLHLGVALAQQGQAEQAMFHFSKAKTLAPENPAPYFNMGFTYIGLEKYEAAVVEFKNALKLNPAYLEALNNLGNAYHKLSRYEEAVACFRKSLKLAPDYPNALLGLSAALCKCQAYEAALDPINRLLQIVPNAYEAHENKGVVLAGLEDYGGAIDEYKKALALNASAPSETYVKLGLAYTKQKSYAEAFAACQKSLALNPSNSDAYVTLGITHAALKQYGDAFAAYRKALELDPSNSEALINLGVAHAGLKQYVDALAAYREALRLNSNNPNAYSNLGSLYCELGQNEDALAAFSRALVLKPTYQWLPGQLLHMRMRLCDWSCYEQSVRQIDSGIGQHQKICTPFPMLSFSASLHLQKTCAAIYANSEMLTNVVSAVPEYQHAKIRIGYLSCDFREHALSYLMSGVVAAHDRSRFEVYGIDFGLDHESAMRKTILNAFDQVHKVCEMSDQDISSLIRRLEIDILVDLTGHTADARTGILASRPAPIQVNYLGYPGTMGATYIDYIVGDDILIPLAYRDGYSEKVAYLPECFQANDMSRQIAATKGRADFGLDDHAFVFGCFNQCVKFTPAVFTVWMSILKQVPNSVLWLIEDSETQARNLKSFAIAHGVPADRLVFAEKLPYAEHLARYALMDLALDTFPFNGGTTTSDALWGGAPVLTYSGETFASRMAASLLSAVGLPELVASSLAAYEAMAVELATQPTKLDDLRQRLAVNRLTSPLFDTPRFTRHLEAAYEQMVLRNRQGLAPDHLYVVRCTQN